MKRRFHYVYILVSDHDASRHYTGRCVDMEDRLRRHNSGQVDHTAKFGPWHIETAVAFCSEAKAIAFERYLKTGSGREFARHHF